MIKKLNILLACGLCVSNAMAQTDKPAVDNDENKIELGRSVSYDLKESTGAISGANAEQLSHKNSIKVANQFYGLLSGLQVLQNSGSAWEGSPTMFVRGMGTLNGKNPLVMIDGFERSITEIVAEEVESVQVLKDAVATSIYGMRGANGVILVTTKRGSMSKPKLTFSYQFDMGTPNRLPEFVDGYTYANALNEALINDGQEARYDAMELDAFKNQTHPLYYPNVDWVGETLRDKTFGDNVSFSARGGGEFVRYYTMLNFVDSRGLMKPKSDNDGYSVQQKYSKLNVRTNLDITVSPTTLVKLNLMGNFSEHNRPGAQNDDLFEAIYQVPSAAFPIQTERGIWGGTTTYSNNPVALIAAKGYARSQTRALFADIDFHQDLSALLPGLALGAKVGIDNTATYWDSNTKNFGYESAEMDLATGETSFNTLRNEGNLSFSKSVGNATTLFNFQAYLQYNNSWDKHHLNSTFVYSVDKLKKKSQNEGRAFLDAALQAHYSYDHRYLLDFSLASTASSVLNPDDRWGIFPSVGAGWVLSEENFMKKDWLNLLKLRASYGIVGRADYDLDLYKTILGGGGGYRFGSSLSSVSGSKIKQLGIMGLTYEKSHKLNVGVDFKAWNKLSMSVDAFYDHRTDILVDAKGAVSNLFGLDAPKVNNGIVDNKGVEAQLSWDDKIGKVSYHLGGQFSFVRNEIKQMNEEYRPYDYQYRTGHSIGQPFGYEVIGIYQSQEEIDNRDVKQLLDEVRPGDLMFKDQNGDKIIDSYDQIPMGYNATCPELYYSFDLGAEYKGFGFYALFQGVGNYSTTLNTRSIYRPIVSNNTISEYYYANRWSQSNPNGTLPRLTYKGSANNYSSNTLWYADASFLKLRTLEFYYNLPQKLMQKTKFIGGVKLFARAHDLFCLDNIDLQDPEAMGAVHPTLTQYSFGFNMSF